MSFRQIKAYVCKRGWLPGVPPSRVSDLPLTDGPFYSIGCRHVQNLDMAMKLDTNYLNHLVWCIQSIYPSLTTVCVRELHVLGELINQSDLVEYQKHKESQTDFSKVALNVFGKVEITNGRYKTRVRPSKNVCAFFHDAWPLIILISHFFYRPRWF